MSAHTLRFVVDDVAKFDDVDRVIERRVRDYTGWEHSQAAAHILGPSVRVTLTPVGDPPRGRGFQHWRAEVEVVV